MKEIRMNIFSKPCHRTERSREDRRLISYFFPAPLAPKFLCLLVACVAVVALAPTAVAQSTSSRVKDLTTVYGDFSENLQGWGVVIGLNDTGDDTAATRRAMANFFSESGLRMTPADIKGKNMGLVFITAELPRFSRLGAKLDVTISSMGEIESLQGGILMQTPLKGPDGTVYSVARGPIFIGTAGGRTTNPNKGSIVGGAQVVKALDNTTFYQASSFSLDLKHPDFTTALNISAVINEYAEQLLKQPGEIARPENAGKIAVRIPNIYQNDVVKFISKVEGLTVLLPDKTAKVVFNDNTETIVVEGHVRVSPVILNVGGRFLEVRKEENLQKMLEKWSSSGGIPYHDMVGMLRALKATGALHGELEGI